MREASKNAYRTLPSLLTEFSWNFSESNRVWSGLSRLSCTCWRGDPDSFYSRVPPPPTAKIPYLNVLQTGRRMSLIPFWLVLIKEGCPSAWYDLQGTLLIKTLNVMMLHLSGQVHVELKFSCSIDITIFIVKSAITSPALSTVFKFCYEIFRQVLCRKQDRVIYQAFINFIDLSSRFCKWKPF